MFVTTFIVAEGVAAGAASWADEWVAQQPQTLEMYVLSSPPAAFLLPPHSPEDGMTCAQGALSAFASERTTFTPFWRPCGSRCGTCGTASNTILSMFNRGPLVACAFGGVAEPG